MTKPSKNFTEESFKELWLKLDDNSKSKLFYYSLFDFMSNFEENSEAKVFFNAGMIETELIDFVNKKSPHFFSKFSLDSFRYAVSSDELCKFIIKEQLNTKHDIKLYHKKNCFPDLKNYDGTISLELKRPVTGSNLKNYLFKIDENKISEDSKIVVLIVFPLLEGENCLRIQRLIDGYHAFEKYLGSKFKSRFVVNCGSINNLDEIINRAAKALNS